MPNSNTVFRLIMGVVTIMSTILILFIGVQLVEPIYQQVPSAPASLGWGDLKGTIWRFYAVVGIGIPLVVLLWWWAGPIISDVRQDQRPPRP